MFNHQVGKKRPGLLSLSAAGGWGRGAEGGRGHNRSVCVCVGGCFWQIFQENSFVVVKLCLCRAIEKVRSFFVVQPVVPFAASSIRAGILSCVADSEAQTGLGVQTFRTSQVDT